VALSANLLDAEADMVVCSLIPCTQLGLSLLSREHAALDMKDHSGSPETAC